MKAPYRTSPGPSGSTLYQPLVRIRIGKKKAAATRFFEAMVDSGAAECMFHKDIAEAIGIKLEAGELAKRSGIGGEQEAWLHDVVLYIGEHVIPIRAAFVKSLPIAGLLGRVGFFEHFKITFDPSSNPPGMEFERIHRS